MISSRRTGDWCGWLLAALPFVPLATAALSLPGFLASASATRLVAAGVFMLALAVGWGSWRTLLRRPLAVGVLLFLAVMVAAAALAEDSWRAFFGELLRGEGVVQAAAWVAVFFAAAVVYKEEQRLRLFLRVSTLVALGYGIGAVVQVMANWLLSADGAFMYRISWPFFNPLFFGNFMALSAGAALWLSRIESGRMRRLAAVAAVLLIVMAGASGSRSVPLGVLGAVLAAAAFRVVHRRSWPLRLTRRIVAGAALVMLAATVLAVSSPEFFGRLQNVSPVERSAFNRFLVWQRDLPYILERPLFGWGPESHLLVYYRWFTADFYSRTPEIFDRAHSAAVETAVTMGFVGLASGLALFAVLFGTISRLIALDSARRQGWLTAGAIAGYVVASDLVGFQTIFTLALLAPLAGAVLGAAAAGQGQERRLPAPAFGIAAAVAAVYLAVAVILPLRAAVLAVSAYELYMYDLPAALVRYAKATAIPGFMDDHFGKYFGNLVEKEILTRQVRDETQVIAAGRLADKVLRRAEAAHPWEMTVPLSRAMLYEQLGKLDASFFSESVPLLESLVAEHPERFEPRQILALAYLREERFEAALAQYEIMLEKNPDIPALHQLYAITLYRTGRTPEALAALDEALRLAPDSRERIAGIRERFLKGELLDPGLPGLIVTATDVDGQGVVEP